MSTLMPSRADQVDGQVIDFVQLFAALWAGRWMVLLLTVILAAAGGSYAFLAPPVYRATAVLSPASTDHGLGAGGGALSQLGGLASLAGISLDARNSSTEEALAVFRSREFIERFIRDHDLLPRMFPRHWDMAAKRWTVSEDRQPTPARGFKYFNSKVLSVSKDKKTGLVAVTVDWRDRNEAASWANELVARVNGEMQSRAMANATAYTEYLERELASTQLLETRQAISRLIESQIKLRMVATVTPEYAFRTVDRALPPDRDDRLAPQRLVILVASTIAGFLLGCVVVLGYQSVKRKRVFWSARSPTDC